MNSRKAAGSVPRPCRRAFSLLEVVISLAILVTVLVILSRMADTGADGAIGAEESTFAQLYAESIMSGYTSGTVQPVSQGETSVVNAFINMFSDTFVPMDEEWVYEVQVVPCQQAGIDYLLEVTVIVRKANALPDEPGYTLVRWVRDPNQATEEETEAVE